MAYLIMIGRMACPALVVAALTASAPASAQQPTFRSGVDLVQLDVTVVDGDDRPVRGLTASDFVVREDGQERPISAFQAIEADVSPVTLDTERAGWVREVSVDRASNDVADGRLIVIVMDNAMTPGEPALWDAARAIGHQVVDGLAPGDRAAVVYTWQTVRPQNFTADRARLRAAVDRFPPGPYMALPPTLSQGRWPAFDLVDTSSFMASLRTLRMVAEALGQVPDRRKVVAYVGPGVPADPDKAQGRSPAGSVAETDLHRGLLQELQDVFARAARANVAIYSYDPSGNGGLQNTVFNKLIGWRTFLRTTQTPLVPSNSSWSTARAEETGDIRLLGEEARRKSLRHVEFLEGIAAGTGGRALFNSNNFEPAVARMFEDTGSYYLLGIASASGEAGRIGRIDVDVTRPGLRVRLRRGFEAADQPAPDVAPVDVEIVAALEGLLPATGIALHAAATPLAPAADGLTAVALAIEVGVPGGRPTPESLRLMVGAFSPTGREIRTDRYQLDLAPSSSPDTSMLEIATRLDVPPGTHELRIAADLPESGRAGSLYADVDVPDFTRGGLGLSGIILGATDDEGQPPAGPLAAFVSFTPVVERTFAATDILHAFVRVHPGRADAPGPVALTVSVVDDRDRTVTEQRVDLLPSVFEAGRGAGHTIALPLAEFSPGEYLLRVQATRAAENAVQQVRFSVR